MSIQTLRFVGIVLVFFTISQPHLLWSESPQSVTIGVSTPLTGDGAPAGLDIKDALLFANDKYFHGKYKFIFEDDQCDKKTGLTIAQKFTALDKVHYVVGMLCNSVLLTTAPLYERSGVVVITTGATTGDVIGAGKTIFRPYPADHLAAEILYDYIAKHHQKLGIITHQEEYAELMERTFLRKNDLAEKPLTIYTEQLPPSVRDFRPLLLRLKSKGIDSIFLNAIGEADYIEMVKQLREMKLNTPHYASCLPASPTSRDGLGATDEGARFANMPLFETSLTSEGSKVYGEYIWKMGKPRSTPIFIVLTIDSLRMLDQAVTSGKPVAEYLRAIKFPGLAGNISFDNDGAVRTLNYEMQEIRNGEVVALRE